MAVDVELIQVRYCIDADEFLMLFRIHADELLGRVCNVLSCADTPKKRVQTASTNGVPEKGYQVVPGDIARLSGQARDHSIIQFPPRHKTGKQVHRSITYVLEIDFSHDEGLYWSADIGLCTLMTMVEVSGYAQIEIAFAQPPPFDVDNVLAPLIFTPLPSNPDPLNVQEDHREE